LYCFSFTSGIGNYRNLKENLKAKAPLSHFVNSGAFAFKAMFYKIKYYILKGIINFRSPIILPIFASLAKNTIFA